MKKILAVFVMLMFFVCMSGCDVSTGTTSNYAKIGKLAGAYVVLYQAEKVSQVKTYAQGLLALAETGNIDSTTLIAAANLLANECAKDEKIVAYINMALILFDIEINTGTVNSDVVSLLNGFISGLGATTVEATKSLKAVHYI
ncbi:MAG: hypothetical protein ABFD76_15380 [Smithella sp.]